MIIKINIREINVLLLGQLPVLAVPALDVSNLWNLGSLHGVGPPLAVAEVPQELVDAVIAE